MCEAQDSLIGIIMLAGFATIVMSYACYGLLQRYRINAWQISTLETTRQRRRRH